jgi:hypothetical protein
MGFLPGEHSIIIGRGRLVKNHTANKKFEKMIARIAPKYQGANCKSEKGNILSQLIDEIHAAGPDAGFVKKDPVTGRWTLVEESLARTTAAQAIRNYLHGDYRSSKQFKQKRRIQQIRAGLIPTSGSNGFKSTTTCISPDASDDESSVDSPDTFTILYNAFGVNAGSDDPFAPTPILTKIDSQGQLNGTVKERESTPFAVVSPEFSANIKTLYSDRLYI